MYILLVYFLYRHLHLLRQGGVIFCYGGKIIYKVLHLIVFVPEFQIYSTSSMKLLKFQHLFSFNIILVAQL